MLGSMGIYNPAYPMPQGLSVAQMTKAGLVNGNPGTMAAWEDAREYNKGVTNPGNNVWAFGAWNLLGPRHVQRLDFNRSRILTAEVGSTCGVYSATGPLWTAQGYNAKHFEAILAALKAAPDGPLIMLGTGLGSDPGCDRAAIRPLRGGLQAEALRAIGEHFRTQGGFMTVRGACTKRFLHNAGLTIGVEPIGCPSLFINTQPDLGATLQRKYRALVQKLRAGASIKVGILLGYKRQSYMDPALARFYISHHAGSVHIMQWPYTEKQQFIKAVDALSSDAGVRAAVRNASRFFYEVGKWKEEVRGLDLVVGPRIHGSMIAIAAETPTVTIGFDARIKELCEAMKLGCSATVGNDLAVTIEQVASSFDGAAFDANRRAVAARYVHLFGSAGIELNPLVAKLAAGVLS